MGDHLPGLAAQSVALNTTDGLGGRMRTQRHRFSMTPQQLPAASGVCVGYLSQVARGNASPSLGTLPQIALALEADVEYFGHPHRADSNLSRGMTLPKFAVAGSSVEYEQTDAERTGREVTSYVMNVPPGCEFRVVNHVGEENISVLEGRIFQIVSEREYLMSVAGACRGRAPQECA